MRTLKASLEEYESEHLNGELDSFQPCKHHHDDHDDEDGSVIDEPDAKLELAKGKSL